MKENLKWPIFLVLVVISCLFCCNSLTFAGGTVYQFENPALFNAILSSDGNFLYIAHTNKNCIIEIDTASMGELRRFTLTKPYYMELSPSGTFLYSTLRGDPGGLARIDLTTGLTEIITVTGDVLHMAVNQTGDRIWLIERLWPLPGDSLSDFLPPDAGKLTEISCSGPLILTDSICIDSVPNSIFYSPISIQLYVKHSQEIWSYNDEPPYYNSPPDAAHEIITVYDATQLIFVDQILGGSDPGYQKFSRLSSWDENSRYLLVPSYQNPIPPSSLRVIDTFDDTVAFDLSFPAWPDKPAGLQYAHLQPGTNYIWITGTGNQLSESDPRELMVRVNTVTHEHQFFPVDEAVGRFGDFAISPDGNTFYLTVVPTGEVIVWSPSTP